MTLASIEFFNGCPQRAKARDCCCNFGGTRAHMLGKKPRTQIRDCAPRRGIGCLDEYVAFGVEPDRTIIEVGRTDAEEAVVNDDRLGVNQYFLRAFGAEYNWKTGTQATVAVG